MGHKHIDTLPEATSPGTQECVGESGKDKKSESAGNLAIVGTKATKLGTDQEAPEPSIMLQQRPE